MVQAREQRTSNLLPYRELLGKDRFTRAATAIRFFHRWEQTKLHFEVQDLWQIIILALLKAGKEKNAPPYTGWRFSGLVRHALIDAVRELGKSESRTSNEPQRYTYAINREIPLGRLDLDKRDAPLHCLAPTEAQAMAIEELGQVSAILNRDPGKGKLWAEVTLGRETLMNAGVRRGVTEARISQICRTIDRQILAETEAGRSSGLKRIPRPPLKFPVLA